MRMHEAAAPSQSLQMLEIAALVLSWVSYGFGLFSIGEISITVSVLAGSVGLFLFARLTKSHLWGALPILLSAIWGVWAGVNTGGVPAWKMVTHFGQTGLSLGFLALGFRAGSPSPAAIRRVVLPISAVVVVFAWYQVPARRLGLPGDFLPITNEQVTGDEGHQRGYSAGPRFTRASSLFPEPSDLGRYSAWLLLLSVFGQMPARLQMYLRAIGIGGILVAQSLGGMIGGLFVALSWMVSRCHPGHWRFRRGGLRYAASVIVVVALALAAVKLGFIEPVVARITGLASGETALATTARFADTILLAQLIGERALVGYGLGSAEYLPGGPLISSNYLLILLERGLVGATLFFTPLLAVILRKARYPGMRWLDLSTAWLALELLYFSSFAMLYFPPFYYALGLALRESRPTRAAESLTPSRSAAVTTS